MVNANNYARGQWSIRRRGGCSRGHGLELGRRIEEVMEDRYGVSRTGAYIENMCPWLDPWKKILAGMCVLLYHGMGDALQRSGIERYHKKGQYCEMRPTDTRVAGLGSDRDQGGRSTHHMRS